MVVGSNPTYVILLHSSLVVEHLTSKIDIKFPYFILSAICMLLLAARQHAFNMSYIHNFTFNYLL